MMKRSFPSILLVFSLLTIFWINGCAPASPMSPPELAVPAEQSVDNAQGTITEVEEFVGFNVLLPTYLPAGASLDFASFEPAPSPATVLHFKFVHERYGDLGPFFEIRQEAQTDASPASLSCGGGEGCELVPLGEIPVLYHLYASPAGEGQSTESLEWYADGFAFRLHRMAGEPNKLYKEDLLKVVESMQ